MTSVSINIKFNELPGLRHSIFSLNFVGAQICEHCSARKTGASRSADHNRHMPALTGAREGYCQLTTTNKRRLDRKSQGTRTRRTNFKRSLFKFLKNHNDLSKCSNWISTYLRSTGIHPLHMTYFYRVWI